MPAAAGGVSRDGVCKRSGGGSWRCASLPVKIRGAHRQAAVFAHSHSARRGEAYRLASAGKRRRDGADPVLADGTRAFSWLARCGMNPRSFSLEREAQALRLRLQLEAEDGR
jgi:hypothetical protein